MTSDERGQDKAGADSPPNLPQLAWIGRRPEASPIPLAVGISPSEVEFCDALVAAVPGHGARRAPGRHGRRDLVPRVHGGRDTLVYGAVVTPGDLLTARLLADWLDGVYPVADERVQNVVDVSFLENLPWPPDFEAAAEELLGPVLC